MPDWLTNLLPAIAGLAGVVLGVWMTQRGAETLSKQTLDGQRMLANDAALREWRRQQVAPYLEAANRRAQFFLELMLEVGSAERDEAASGESFSLAERPKLARLLEEVRESSSYFGLHLTGATIPDNAFRAAFKQVFDSEKFDEGAVHHGYEEYRQVVERLMIALAALNEAAERYVFSPLPSEKS